MAVVLRCPDCRDTFSWDTSKKTPRYCPLCRADMGEERADDDIVMPFVRSASSKTKSIDGVYRDIEKSSEVRVEKAAEMAGVSAAEMSGLKVTNLNDRNDTLVAAVEDKAAAQRLSVAGNGPRFAGGGAEFSAGISTGDVTVDGKTVRGIAPRAGASAIARVQRLSGRL